MGFIGTGLSKLGAASAQQLGIAAAASLSVMAVSFSAIAYQGYVAEKQQEQAQKKSVMTAESRFQEVFYNGNYDDAPAVLGENEVAGAVSNGDNVAERALPVEENANSSGANRGGQDGQSSGPLSNTAQEESTETEETTEETETTKATEAESTEESTETITEIVDSQSKKTVKNNVQESVAPAPESTSQNEENTAEAAKVVKPVADLNTPETVAESAADVSSVGSIPVKSDSFAQFYGSSTFNDYNVFLDTAMGPMAYYNQHDSHWGKYLYGGQDSISKYGCGPTTVAMIVSSFGNVNGSITPKEMAEWSSHYKFYAPQSGSYHDYIPSALSAFDLMVDSVQERTPAKVAELLNSGHILVALMGKGALTNGGHFVIITKQNPNGTVSIADPNSYKKTQQEWDPAQLMRELKKNYDGGGPLWSVSSPRNYGR